MSSQKSFNKKYERFFMTLGFGFVWIIGLWIVSVLMNWDNKTFGIVLILCGLTGFYQEFVEGVILKKEKKNDNNRRGKKIH
jgi:hypothetical protein